ncbi:AraC family transcriptional regulator [Paenibacillus sp. P26]|nr:AraC family transcriptional regulator [Paenibacillus sp. P26]
MENPGEFANRPHMHEDAYQFTFPLSGICRFNHENRSYHLEEGQGLVQHPRELHEFGLGDRDEVMIIQVKKDRFVEWNGRGAMDFALTQSFDAKKAVMHFRRWSQALFALEPADRLAVEQTECDIVAYLLETLQGGGRAQTVASRRPFVKDSHIARAVEYIHEHYTSDIDLDTMATIALQSRFHFVRSFKAAVGMTPYQYVLQLRIEEAKRLLTHTDMTVTEISFRLGFSSTSQFYRQFSRSAGVTPERYRKGR